MNETAEKKPARAVNLAHPVVRGIFGLAGVVFVVVTVIDIKEGSSIGAIVRSASTALAGLVMAVFAKTIAERSERKQSELPGWPDVVTRNPLKHLFGSLWIFSLLAAVFFLDLLLARPLATGAVFLAGAVCISLYIYTFALLHGRFSKVVGMILASPFAFGFLSALGWVDLTSTRLTEPDATFNWMVVCGGIGGIAAASSQQFQAAVTKDMTGEDAMTPVEETPDAQPGGEPVETGEETGPGPVETEEQTSEGESE
jgi:hypothetical protein